MLAYVFPGQGSQVVGMGKDLFDEFKEYVDAADEILGYSIKELCLEDPNGVLGLTQYTQPALYVVNALTYLKEVKTTGVKPDFVAGHSLGEYDALFAAGVFDFATGLKLVQKRGELMSQAKGGGMAAVLGLKEEECVIQMQNLITKIHKKSKKTKIFFVSIPLYPGRNEKLQATILDYNSDMKAFCKKNKKYVTYLDLQSKLMKGKNPDSSKFSGKEAGKNLYLTSKGYKTVKSVIVKKVRKAVKKK